MVEYVKCITLTPADWFTTGKIYEVIKFVDNDVLVIDDDGESMHLFEGDFKKVEDFKPASDNPFINNKPRIVDTSIDFDKDNSLWITVFGYSIYIGLDSGPYTKEEVTKIARLLTEVAEVMD